MAGRAEETHFIVYDTESVPDGELLARVQYPGETIDPAAALARFREERLERGESDFIPVTYQVPVSIGVARVSADFRLLDLAALDAPGYDSRRMVSRFWSGLEFYRQAKIVDFNGRGFDIPLLTIAAFRFGISCPTYFRDPDRFGFRYRFTDKHIDLQEWLSEYGGFRMHGGLNLLAKALGKPGKLDTRGDPVEALFNEGKIQEINDYCLRDVLDTYFVFLRTRVLTGELTLEGEQELVREMREWIESRVDTNPALASYLEHFGEWQAAPGIVAGGQSLS